MCGIYGSFRFSGKEVDKKRIHEMGRLIAHRGPNDSGCYFSSLGAIGNERLSIFDIEGGHQPFSSTCNKIHLVQNGEIYNHVELRQELQAQGVEFTSTCDTEVLLKLYESEGMSFLSKLNGMFAIAILDERLGKLFLARDRVGVKPLYICNEGGNLLFSSEIKSFFTGEFKKELNQEALGQYLSFNYVPPPMTIFKGIEHVMPGTYMEISQTGTEVHHWWKLNKVFGETQQDESKVKETFLDLLSESVKIRMRSDVPFGAFLSGGLDSSSVVAMMAKHSDDPIKTFSIGFHDQRFDESRYARMASELFNTQHYEKIVEDDLISEWSDFIYYCDQPHGDISFLPTLELSRNAVKEVTVVLTGDGGDELFCGYDKYRDFFSADYARNTSELADQYFSSLLLFNPSDVKALLNPEVFNNANMEQNLDLVRRTFAECEHLDPINKALYFDTKFLLPGNNLVKPDRMGMAVSLEARTPFLDYRMVEFAFTIPGEMKLRDGITKQVFKSAVEPILGEQLTYRKKQMFTVPVGEWFRDSLATMCRARLCGSGSRLSEYMNQNMITEMVDLHLSGAKNYTREIRALIALDIWLEKFFE